MRNSGSKKGSEEEGADKNEKERKLVTIQEVMHTHTNTSKIEQIGKANLGGGTLVRVSPHKISHLFFPLLFIFLCPRTFSTHAHTPQQAGVMMKLSLLLLLLPLSGDDDELTLTLSYPDQSLRGFTVDLILASNFWQRRRQHQQQCEALMLQFQVLLLLLLLLLLLH